MKKRYEYYCKFPRDVYALGPIPDVKSLREVREWARKFAGVKRLPAGFQCWRNEL